MSKDSARFQYVSHALLSPASSAAGLHGSLDILAACLDCGLHLVQVDAFLHHQTLGVVHGLRRQEARPAEDPGVVDVEDAQDVDAGVHHGHAGVVGGQDPVRAVGGEIGEADAKFGRLSWVMDHCCPLGLSYLVFIQLKVQHRDGTIHPYAVVSLDALSPLEGSRELLNLVPFTQVLLKLEARLHFGSGTGTPVIGLC